MVKLVFTLKRRADMSREEFLEYWLQNHGPLVRSHAQALRIRRYVQVHTMETELNAQLGRSRNSPEQTYDGVAEAWWDSLEDLRQAFASEEGKAAGAELLADEQRFIDLESSPLWLGEEHELVG